MHPTPQQSYGKRLTFLAIALALCVIVLGAYTRLTDAGLGCPDWPGCYGQVLVPQTAEMLEKANAAYPDRPVEQPKAWAEMIHRYLAGTLGLLVGALLLVHHYRKTPHRILVSGLTLLIIAQAALGMWTVTLGLLPGIVTAHLLGGFATFSLLILLAMRQSPLPTTAMRALGNASASRSVFRYASLSLVVLILQISLGAWTAANYAATACLEFPLCQGNWWERLAFVEAFQLWGHPVNAYEGGQSLYEFGQHLSLNAKITIHVLHRFGAIIATLTTGWVVWQLYQRRGQISQAVPMSARLLALLCIQVSLGIANVAFHLPLGIAVAHNLFAALLLAQHLQILQVTYQQTSQTKHEHLHDEPYRTQVQSPQFEN